LGKPISFFLDTGASRSVLTDYAGPLAKASFLIVWVNGIPNMPNITHLSTASLDLNLSLALSLFFWLVLFQY
jgi:hypothetical protein